MKEVQVTRMMLIVVAPTALVLLLSHACHCHPLVVAPSTESGGQPAAANGTASVSPATTGGYVATTQISEKSSGKETQMQDLEDNRQRRCCCPCCCCCKPCCCCCCRPCCCCCCRPCCCCCCRPCCCCCCRPCCCCCPCCCGCRHRRGEQDEVVFGPQMGLPGPAFPKLVLPKPIPSPCRCQPAASLADDPVPTVNAPMLAANSLSIPTNGKPTNGSSIGRDVHSSASLPVPVAREEHKTEQPSTGCNGGCCCEWCQRGGGSWGSGIQSKVKPSRADEPSTTASASVTPQPVTKPPLLDFVKMGTPSVPGHSQLPLPSTDSIRGVQYNK